MSMELTKFFNREVYGINLKNMKPITNEGDLWPYATAIMQCAAIDGLSEEEEAYIKGSFLARGCSPAFVERLVGAKNASPDVEALKKFSDSDKCGVVYNLYKAAGADGISEKEDKFIHEIAMKIGVPKQKIEAIHKIYMREVKLKKELMDVIGRDWLIA